MCIKSRIPDCVVVVGGHYCTHSMTTTGMMAELVSLFCTFSEKANNNNINHILPDILCEMKENRQHFKARCIKVPYTALKSKNANKGPL